ncbi:MAG: alpha/beta hydrolase [Sphingomonas bacterium]|nr:alpha/beta hydrolase [Sphingomonas bacterium]
MMQRTKARDDVAPPLRRLAAELPAFFRRPFWAPSCRRIARAHRGDGRVVMVIPGFLAGDIFTSRLRRTLDLAGYRAEGWRLGINWGVRADLLDRLSARIDAIDPARGPVVLIGWSLGGIYARALAKIRPDRVDRVITLGSPFSGDPHANNAWRLYEMVNRHPVEAPPIAVDLATKPPVPTFALWSARDGIVAPASTRGRPGESDRRIEVDCRHTDFCTHPRALTTILEAISAGTAPPPRPAP